MAYCRIIFPCFLLVLIACFHLVTIGAQPSQSDVGYDYEDSEPYVPPKQSVYETMYKKDQDHHKKSVYERLYKPQKTENEPVQPQKDSNGFEYFPRSTDHPIEVPIGQPKPFSTYIPMIFIFLIIVALVLITLLHKFPTAFLSKPTTPSNVKPATTPSPTRSSEKKKRKTMLRRLQEIPKQQAQEIIQNDVQALIRTDSNKEIDATIKEDSPKKESNDNSIDSDTEIMDAAKEDAKTKYNTVATMDHKPKRKNMPLFQDDKKKSNRKETIEKPIVEEKPKKVEEKSLTTITITQPSSNPSSPVKGTAGIPGTEQPDTVESHKEDSKISSVPQQPLNNNKGSLPEDGLPPPSPAGERDIKFLYNIISSIKTEKLTEEQKIAFAQLLLQKYAMDYEVEKRQSKQQEFLIKEQNKQKRHEDEIQFKLAATDEVFQHNMFLLATILLLGTWFFCLTQRYHGLVALILNYWWDFGKYCIDSIGISIVENHHSYWTWVNPFNMFEDMVLRTITLLFALGASIFLAILTLRSPRLGICITAYITLHVCWESLLRVVVASAPLYFVIFVCCSLLTMKYPKISYSRNMYKGAITVCTMGMSAWLGYQLVICDPLNPERMQGSIMCAILDLFL